MLGIIIKGIDNKAVSNLQIYDAVIFGKPCAAQINLAQKRCCTSGKGAKKKWTNDQVERT